MPDYTVQNLLDLGFTLEELHKRGVLAVNPEADVLRETAEPAFQLYSAGSLFL